MQHADIPREINSYLLSKTFKATDFKKKKAYTNIYVNTQYCLTQFYSIYLVLYKIVLKNIVVYWRKYLYRKTCLKRTPYIPETWKNGK